MREVDNNKIDEKRWTDLVKTTKIKKVFRLNEIPSTNDWAKEFLLGNADSDDSAPFLFDAPILFIARKQTAGRGRASHSWWSPEGGLFLSFVALRRDFGLTDDDSVELSIRVAQGVARTVSTVLAKKKEKKKKEEAVSSESRRKGASPSVRVKHPNDVLLGGKKVAGILIESPTPERVVIGIGVNLNNSTATAPEEIRGRLASLFDIDGETTDPVEFVEILTEELFASLPGENGYKRPSSRSQA